jgi:hypothetical protein
MKINEKKFIGKAFVGIDVHKSNWKDMCFRKYKETNWWCLKRKMYSNIF